MLKKFGMENCAPISTPMVITCKLRKYEESIDENKILYILMIDILLYFIALRFDIMQVIELVSRFQSAPKKTSMKVLKGFFRYLKGTMDFGLWYSRSKDFTLITYTDAKCLGSVDDKKNTKWSRIILGKLSGIMVKQETRLNISIHN